MFIQFKNKGGLVLVYIIVPLITLMIITKMIDEHFFTEKMIKKIYGIAFGLSLIISGYWTYYTSDDYYIDENGEKKYIYFDHQFMYFDMKTWAYALWTIGGIAFVGSLIELIKKII